MELSYVHLTSGERCVCFEFNGHNPCNEMKLTTFGSGPHQGQTLHEIFNWDNRFQVVEPGMIVARNPRGRHKAFHRWLFLLEYVPAHAIS